VPNATVMLIEQPSVTDWATAPAPAGRVGRARESYCSGDAEVERHRARAHPHAGDSNDGFAIPRWIKAARPGEFFARAIGLPGAAIQRNPRCEILEVDGARRWNLVTCRRRRGNFRRAVTYIQDHWQRRYGLSQVG